MSLGSVRTTLLADSDVTNITSAVWVGRLPQGTAYPAVVINLRDTRVDTAVSNNAIVDNNSIQISCFSTSGVEAENLAKAVRGALSSSGVVRQVIPLGFEAETETFGYAVLFSEWVAPQET